jgi:hypothetical protein
MDAADDVGPVPPETEPGAPASAWRPHGQQPVTAWRGGTTGALVAAVEVAQYGFRMPELFLIGVVG